MSFGQKAKDVKPLETDGSYLRNFRVGETTVRFCEETDDWIQFYEHYNSDGKSYPCTRDRKNCPGCNSVDQKERKASCKYATTMKLTGKDVNGDVYLPVRVPVSVKKKMDTRSERNNGTILNRDYVIIREGNGLDTEYDVEADRTYDIPVKDMKSNLFNTEEILQSMWDAVWEDGKEDDDDSDGTYSLADLKKMSIRDLRGLARDLKIDGEIAELGDKEELIEAIVEAAAE